MSEQAETETLNLRETLMEEVDKLMKADDTVKSAALDLSDHLDLEGMNEEEVQEAIQQRRKQAALVGMLLLRWYRAGGRIDFQMAPPLSVVDEPEPEPDDLDGDFTDEEVDQALTEFLEKQEPEPEPEPELSPAVVKAPPPAQPATKMDLSKLKSWASGKIDLKKQMVENLLSDVNPREVKDLNDYNSAVSMLDRYSSDMQKFEDLEDRNIRKAVLGLLAAQSRHLQDEAGPRLNHPFMSSVLDRVFRSLTHYGKTYRPGFVFGLSRNHDPEFGENWVGEQKYWADILRNYVDPQGNHSSGHESEQEPELNPEKALARLAKIVSVDDPDRKKVCAAAVECLDAGVRDNDPRILKDLFPYLKLLTREKRLKGLRKAIRDYKKELEAEGEEAENDNSQVPEDWPYWQFTRGKRLLVLGGDKRETARDRLQTAFEFDSADWETGLNHNRVKSAARKIEHNFYDVVILLARFAGHDIDDAVRGPCKDTGTHFIIIERGYGVSRVKYHLEQYFQGKLDD